MLGKETVLPEPEAVLEDPDLNYELLTPGRLDDGVGWGGFNEAYLPG